MDKTYSIAKASQILGLGRDCIYRYDRIGKIKLVEVNSFKKVTEKDLRMLKREQAKIKNSYTISKAAEMLNVSRWTIYEHERKGDIKFIKQGKLNRLSKDEFEKLKELRNGKIHTN